MINDAAIALTPPALTWSEAGEPISTQFDDVYFSRGSGLAESRRVFLEGNGLEARWQALEAQGARHFHIGETGFGTGLNFLLSAQTWLRLAPMGARLTFTSIEACPMTAAQLELAHRAWPELAPLAQALRTTLPPPLPGLHVLAFAGGRILLRLYYGDAGRALDDLDPGLTGQDAVDAWFLDGFAPARNPDMWRAEVLAGIARLSRPGTTLSSFTVAGVVRRGLAQVGFEVRKAPGFGGKRELLQADYTAAAPVRPGSTAWHAVADGPAAQEAIVVGAGIAGCSTARALAVRGLRVTVLERAVGPAEGASGNPQGMLYTRLPLDDSPHGEFGLHAWLFGLRYYAALAREGCDGLHLDGLLVLPADGPDRRRLDRIAARYAGLGDWIEAVDATRAGRLAGRPVADAGLWLGRSGWIEPRRVAGALLDHPSIRFRGGSGLRGLRHDGDRWRLELDNGEEMAAEHVVLCTAGAAATLLDLEYLRLGSMRGQLTRLPSTDVDRPPAVAICGEGYVTPMLGDAVWVGASYRRDPGDAACSQEEHLENLARLEKLVPAMLHDAPDPATLDGRVGLRCTSRDYLPVAGPAPDVAAFRSRYAGLRRNAREFVAGPGPALPGLFLNLAHGSRGLGQAPLCAELLAAQICREPLPLPRRLVRAVHPGRMLIRELIRGESA